MGRERGREEEGQKKGEIWFCKNLTNGCELWEGIYKIFFKGQYITLHISSFVETGSGHLLYIPFGFL